MIDGKNKKGVSAIEIVIAIGILAALLALITPPFLNYRQSGIVELTAQNIVSQLSEARRLTLSSEGDSRYGVRLELSTSTLFKGASFQYGNLLNKVFVFDKGVTLSPIVLNGGGTDVIFNRLTGATGGYGTATVSSVSNPSRSKNIIIEKTGLINVQ